MSTHKDGEWHINGCSLSPEISFVLRKKGSKTKTRMKEEDIEKGDCGPPTETVLDLNQAVPNHLAKAGESQTR